MPFDCLLLLTSHALHDTTELRLLCIFCLKNSPFLLLSSFRAYYFSLQLPPASYVVGGREEEYPWTASELSKFCKDATRSKDLQSALNKEPLSYRPSLNSMSRQLMGCVDCGSEDDMHKRFDDLLAEIKAPNSKFHIAISERFHESLIVCPELPQFYSKISNKNPQLLKRDYHLQFADLAYVSRNKMDQGYREHKMSDELGQCLHDLNCMPPHHKHTHPLWGHILRKHYQ